MPADGTLADRIIKLGSNLRRERIASGMTQERLAEAADLNIRTVQKIEAGDINILVTTLIRLQEAVGCGWEKILPVPRKRA